MSVSLTVEEMAKDLAISSTVKDTLIQTCHSYAISCCSLGRGTTNLLTTPFRKENRGVQRTGVQS